MNDEIENLINKLRQLPNVNVYNPAKKQIKLQQHPITDEARALRDEAEKLGLYLFIEGDYIDFEKYL
ncbi:hypothetical protein C4577_05240 [Candidatus Parcubacteria bacterium]|nr:MAG: hypothetical protein C4577_05240 [Candidatus Parcubacteria bacterium]